jgi:hypothetical protein
MKKPFQSPTQGLREMAQPNQPTASTTGLDDKSTQQPSPLSPTPTQPIQSVVSNQPNNHLSRQSIKNILLAHPVPFQPCKCHTNPHFQRRCGCSSTIDWIDCIICLQKALSIDTFEVRTAQGQVSEVIKLLMGALLFCITAMSIVLIVAMATYESRQGKNGHAR